MSKKRRAEQDETKTVQGRAAGDSAAEHQALEETFEIQFIDGTSTLSTTRQLWNFLYNSDQILLRKRTDVSHLGISTSDLHLISKFLHASIHDLQDESLDWRKLMSQQRSQIESSAETMMLLSICISKPKHHLEKVLPCDSSTGVWVEGSDFNNPTKDEQCTVHLVTKENIHRLKWFRGEPERVCLAADVCKGLSISNHEIRESKEIQKQANTHKENPPCQKCWQDPDQQGKIHPDNVGYTCLCIFLGRKN